MLTQTPAVRRFDISTLCGLSRTQFADLGARVAGETRLKPRTAVGAAVGGASR
jgi:hypothetical protein